MKKLEPVIAGKIPEEDAAIFKEKYLACKALIEREIAGLPAGLAAILLMSLGANMAAVMAEYFAGGPFDRRQFAAKFSAFAMEYAQNEKAR